MIEVEKFFAGEDNTLLSIWELIEDNKLDEASRLIEEARLSFLTLDSSEVLKKHTSSTMTQTCV